MVHRNTPDLRVVACGGDGTIRWVIQGLIELGFSPIPPIGIIPLGTGNDLSRMFGWGAEYDGSISIQDYIQSFSKSTVKPLDLWSCSLLPWDPISENYHSHMKDTQIMFNYFNMGFDPQVACGFHYKRIEKPHLFKSPFVNKCWYTWYALDTVFKQNSHPITSVCSLFVDDNEIPLSPTIKTVIVLNFVCYQAGLDIWGSDENGNVPKLDDEVVEVIGIEGIIHNVIKKKLLI